MDGDDYGGGFMAKDSSQGDKTSPSTKKLNMNTQSVTAVTCKQVLTAAKENADDPNFKIDGSEVANLKIVGCIVEVKKQSTNNTYTIEDGTGRVDVKQWNNENDDSGAANEVLTEGTYVSVVGMLKAFNNVNSLQTHHIKAVEDFNALTYHLAEVMYQHQCTKRTSFTDFNGSSIPNQTNVVVWGNTKENSGGYKNTSGGAMSSNDLILDVFRKNPCDESGLSLDYIASVLQGKMSMNEVRKTIEYLSAEGHLYSTIDDEHFCSTESPE